MSDVPEAEKSYWRLVLDGWIFVVTSSLLAAALWPASLFGIQIPNWASYAVFVLGICLSLYLAGQQAYSLYRAEKKKRIDEKQEWQKERAELVAKNGKEIGELENEKSLLQAKLEKERAEWASQQQADSQRRELRIKINDLMLEGRQARVETAKVSHQLDVTPENLEVINGPANKWARKVVSFLEVSFPDFVGQFLNDGGFPIAGFVVQHGSASNAIAYAMTYLDHRLARLGELLASIPFSFGPQVLAAASNSSTVQT
jgi:Skp family chaperone for outer membrane proteins